MERYKKVAFVFVRYLGAPLPGHVIFGSAGKHHLHIGHFFFYLFLQFKGDGKRYIPLIRISARSAERKITRAAVLSAAVARIHNYSTDVVVATGNRIRLRAKG